MTDIDRQRAIRRYVERDRFAERLGAKIEALAYRASFQRSG